MQPRRRLPVIAGMALSTVVIAAPAAHANDFLSPRQDCSRTQVRRADRGGTIGDIIDFVVRQGGRIEDVAIDNREENENIRTTEINGDETDINVNNSFNCTSIFERSFRDKFRKHSDHRFRHRDWSDKR